MIRYNDEIKTQALSGFHKIVLPVVMPLYLACQIYDWVIDPSHGLLFLAIRATILPLMALFYIAFKNNWKGPWHLAFVWASSFVITIQLLLMAHMSVRPEGYLIGVSMMGGISLLLFPLPPRQNAMTAACVYIPFFAYLTFNFIAPMTRFAIIFQTIGMAAVFLVTSTSLDRMRYRAFRQRNDLFVLATTDALSGLKLRRYFFNRFIQELSLQFRKKEDLFLSVAMIDIDSFKAINDRYGHPAGDRCIRHIGDLIQKSIRIYDVACRFGGEEFVILFPATPLSETAMVCERIRKAIENSPLMIEKKEIPITVSIGVSGIAPPIPPEVKNIHFSDQAAQRMFLVKSMMRIIKEADGSLYEAKKKGKNQVMLGKAADFSSETAPDENAIIKQYLVYFEQQALVFDSEDNLQQDEADESQVFYPSEFFFRRCVEGLYRRYRDPDWQEVLTLIRVQNADPKTTKKLFATIFRLADVTSVVEPNIIGVLFVGVKSHVLAQIENRIRSRMNSMPGMEKADIRIAAAQLAFDDEEWNLETNKLFSHEDFSRRIEKIFSILKRHRFQPGENIFYYEPAGKAEKEA